MAVHVDLELAQVLVGRDVILFFVRVHSPLEAVVEAGGFRRHAHIMIIQKLHALHIVLKSAICKLGDIDLIRQSKLLDMG